MAHKQYVVLPGDKYNRLTIVSELPIDDKRQRFVLVECECGTTKTLRLYDVINGKTTSCGCFHHQRMIETNFCHGWAGTSEYRAWFDMIKRCTDPSCRAYSYYGARGIKLSEEWINDFTPFIKHIGPKPFKSYELDRVDNDGDYVPGNVRWVSRKINSCNKRNSYRYVVFGTPFENLPDAVEFSGMCRNTFVGKCKRGVAGYERIKKY